MRDLKSGESSSLSLLGDQWLLVKYLYSWLHGAWVLFSRGIGRGGDCNVHVCPIDFLLAGLHFLEVTKMYYTSILDHKQCPLDGGEFYCVLYSECPFIRSSTVHES